MILEVKEAKMVINQKESKRELNVLKVKVKCVKSEIEIGGGMKHNLGKEKVINY